MEVSGPAVPEKVMDLMPGKDTKPSSKRYLVQALATITLAGCALAPAGGFALAAMPAHAATTVVGPAVAASPTQTPYDRIAVRTLDDIVNGDFEAATARFGATMRTVLPPDRLAKAWETYQEEFGRYQSHGEPRDVVFGQFTVVNVPLDMERRPGEFRVSFHKDGSIAGLLFLEPGVPIS